MRRLIFALITSLILVPTLVFGQMIPGGVSPGSVFAFPYGVANLNLTGLTAAQAALAIYRTPTSPDTSGTRQLYMVGCYEVITTAGSGGVSPTQTCTVGWTDESSGTAQSATVFTAISQNTLGLYGQGWLLIQAAGASNITVAGTDGGTQGTHATYSLRAVVFRVQ